MHENRDINAMYSVAAVRSGEHAWWAAPSWFHAFLGHHASGVAATEGLALAAAREVAGPSSRRIDDFLAAYAHWQGREGLAAPRPTGEEVLWVKTGLILALWSWRPHLIVRRTDRSVFVARHPASLQGWVDLDEGERKLLRLDRQILEAKGCQWSWTYRSFFFTTEGRAAEDARPEPTPVDVLDTVGVFDGRDVTHRTGSGSPLSADTAP